MAFLLFSSFAGICLSHLCPFTFCPSPVPLTLRPTSNNLASLKTEDLRLGGSRGSTPYFRASFTRSACRRKEYCGARQRFVSGLRQGRKGLGGGSSVDGLVDNGVSGGGVEVDSVIEALGSEAEVFEACDDRFGRVSGMDAPVYFAEYSLGGWRAKKFIKRCGSGLEAERLEDTVAIAWIVDWISSKTPMPVGC